LLHQRFYLVPDLRNVQAHDNLNAVAAPYHAMCAQGFEDVVTLRQRHVAERDTQPRRAVVEIDNIAVAAECMQIANSLSLC